MKKIIIILIALGLSFNIWAYVAIKAAFGIKVNNMSIKYISFPLFTTSFTFENKYYDQLDLDKLE